MKTPPDKSGDRAPLLQRFPRKRPPRLEPLYSSVYPFYFVTFNTHERLRLLARTEVHHVLRLFCIRAEEHDVAVGRYIIMPDHVHLFVAIPAVGTTLFPNGFMVFEQSWERNCFGLAIRSRTGRRDSSITCYAAPTATLKWEYVRLNPVRAGLGTNFEDWPYQGEIVRIPFD